MKTQIILFLFLLAAVNTSIEAQKADTLLKLVLEENKELKVARESYQAAMLQAATGNTPPDPEVEFAYLFGKPSDLGKRVDFGVTQQLDFPTVYIHRSKVKDIKMSQADLEYLLTRQEVLLAARQLWIEQVYLNQLHALLSKRLQQAESIHTHLEYKQDAGEVGLLEISQSKLQLASLEGEFEEVLGLREHNRLALMQITGGTLLEIPDSQFPLPVNIIPDSLIKAYRLGPYTQLYQQDLKLKEEQKNLAVSKHLPKLSAGYFSESIVDQAFRGFRLGVSVPLWENAKTVKMAKSQVAYAEAAADRSTFRQESEIRQKIASLEALQSRVLKLEDALGSANSISLLTTSMENGEISLSEYFYTSDFYFRNQQQLLRYKRDLLVQEAELMKIYL